MEFKTLFMCFVIFCAVAPRVEMCRSLTAGCWFDSSCCSGLCQRFRCRISEDLFKETDTYLSNSAPNPPKRRKISI